MYRALPAVWHVIRAFIIIYLCLLAGNALAVVLPVRISASILGMLILFTLLTLQILPVQWVKPGCQLLIRYMALLFVPVSVGVMQYTDLLRTQFGPIVISCTVSTLIVLAVVGFCSQYMENHHAREKHHD